MLWTALSRAVRAPARIDRDFHLLLQLPNRPLIPVINGGPDFQSEIADVLEIGYRSQPLRSLSYSVTGFYDFYDRLRSGQPPPAVVQNLMDGTTFGVEAWGAWQASERWRVSLGVLGLHERFALRPGSPDPTGPSALGNDPKFQWTLRSESDLGPRGQLDVSVRHVGALPNPYVPAYTAVDLRYGWQVRPNLEASLTVQNLFDPRHVEFGAAPGASEIDRSVLFRLVWECRRARGDRGEDASRIAVAAAGSPGP